MTTDYAQKRLEELSLLYNQSSYGEVIAGINKLLEQKILKVRQRVMAYELLAKSLVGNGRPNDAINAIDECTKILRKMYTTGDCAAQALIIALQNQAHVYGCANQYKQAEEYSLQAMQLALSSYGPDSSQYASALFHAARPAYGKKDFLTAATRLHEAIGIWQRQENPSEQLGTCLNNLGRVYEELGDSQKAIQYHRNAVEFRRALDNKEDLAFSLGNYGLALASAGQLDEALLALRESLDIYAMIGQQDGKEARSFRANLEMLVSWRDNAGS